MGNYAYTRDQEKSRKSLFEIIIKGPKNVVLWRENCLSKQLRFLERSKKKKNKSFGGKILLV